MVKNLPVVQETQVQSLGQGCPLEKDMTCPLQYSCLENPINRGALWATYSLQGCKELDMTEATEHAHMKVNFMGQHKGSPDG